MGSNIGPILQQILNGPVDPIARLKDEAAMKAENERQAARLAKAEEAFKGVPLDVATALGPYTTYEDGCVVVRVPGHAPVEFGGRSWCVRKGKRGLFYKSLREWHNSLGDALRVADGGQRREIDWETVAIAALVSTVPLVLLVFGVVSWIRG